MPKVAATEKPDMNLHDIKFRLLNVAIWLHANGRNGRDIGAGDHLWVLPEGEPPNTPDGHARRGSRRTRGCPHRFRWAPFPYAHLFRDGWVPPLCGQRTASRSPAHRHRLGRGVSLSGLCHSSRPGWYRAAYLLAST